MADFLQAVDSDAGKEEPKPVTLVSAGAEVGTTGNPLHVTGGASGGTEYTEDAVALADPVGGALLARRRDTLTAAEVSADGDMIALNATAKGQLQIALADGANVAQGAMADAAWSGSGSGTVVSILKALWAALTGTLKVAPPAGIGQQSTAASVSVVASKDQDPIFDHANGTKNSVTTSQTVITPPTGCAYVRISSDVDVFVNAAGSNAVDDGTSIRVIANQPEVIPVTAALAVKALSSSGTATVRCTPMKTR